MSIPKNYKELLQAYLDYLQTEVGALRGPETKDAYLQDLSYAARQSWPINRCLWHVKELLEDLGAIRIPPFEALTDPIPLPTATIPGVAFRTSRPRRI